MKIQYKALLLGAVLLVAFYATDSQAAVKDSGNAKAIRVHMLSGSKEYQSGVCLQVLAAYLETQGMQCSLSLGQDKGKTFPNLEALEQADCLLVFARRMELVPEQLAKIRQWCEQGKPVVALRTASHAFQTWPAFDQEILGGKYSGHDRGEDGIRVDVAAFGHPVLGDVTGWTRPGKLYQHTALADDVTVLLTAAGKKGSQPVAWCRVHPETKARIFYTSLGCIHDFAESRFSALIRNAIQWTVGHLPLDHKDKPRYWVAQLGDIDPIRCPCGFAKRAFARADNALATMHIVDITKDSQVHYHKTLTEIYLVLEGEGFLELDGTMVPAKPMTAVFIKPGCRHRAVGKLRIVNVPIPAFDPADEWFD
jgi:type 1 glutamine amidotransferase